MPTQHLVGLLMIFGFIIFLATVLFIIFAMADQAHRDLMKSLRSRDDNPETRKPGP